MRGELDDALARLRRWDEVRQRLAANSASAPHPARPEEDAGSAAPPPVVEGPPEAERLVDAAGPAWADDGGPTPPEPAVQGQSGSGRGPAPGPAVDEAISAVGEVVRRHRHVAIVVTVRDDDTFWTAHVAIGRDGQVEVANAEPRAASGSMSATGPQPADGMEAPVVEPASDAAAPGYVYAEAPERAASRLADLIRRDPSLLDPPR